MDKPVSRLDTERRKAKERRMSARRKREEEKNYSKNNTVSERRQVNYIKPFIYYFLQLLLLVPLFGMVEMDLNPVHWSGYSYAISAVWIVYSTKKLLHVLVRQKNLRDK